MAALREFLLRVLWRDGCRLPTGRNFRRENG